MVKFLSSLCLVAFAATAISAAAVRNNAKNTAMNAMSTGSEIVQNDIQNVNTNHGFGGYYGGHLGLAAAAYPYGAAPYGFPGAGYSLGHPHHLGYGYEAPFYGGHPGPYVPAAGYEHTHNAGSNTGANIMSKDSAVFQSGVQNANNNRF